MAKKPAAVKTTTPEATEAPAIAPEAIEPAPVVVEEAPKAADPMDGFTIMVSPTLRGTSPRKGQLGKIKRQGGECKVANGDVSRKLNEGYTLPK